MYLVCDGGGTKTEYLLFDRSGSVWGRGRSKGTNAVFLDLSAAAGARVPPLLAGSGVADEADRLGCQILDFEGASPECGEIAEICCGMPHAEGVWHLRMRENPHCAAALILNLFS